MADLFLSLPLADRRDVLESAFGRGLTRSTALLEKDVWVVWDPTGALLGPLCRRPRLQGRDVAVEGLQYHPAIFRGRRSHLRHSQAGGRTGGPAGDPDRRRGKVAGAQNPRKAAAPSLGNRDPTLSGGADRRRRPAGDGPTRGRKPLRRLGGRGGVSRLRQTAGETGIRRPVDGRAGDAPARRL
jgi:hypothetical protein